MRALLARSSAVGRDMTDCIGGRVDGHGDILSRPTHRTMSFAGKDSSLAAVARPQRANSAKRA